MSGTSNVGNSQVYEAGDQRNESDAVKQQKKEEERFHEGKENSHAANDPKDERSIANRLAHAEKDGLDNESGKNLSEDDKLAQQDATAPAKAHGNKPSKGAEIDQQLREEEEELLKKKGAYNPQ
ncbi:uncharacterized protein RCC_10716 [Ramularia collo-cygni]|uniref:Uncharacterized protein n=1 Tax=Ramularia collo-cygni TaxID=112498 RepID=A0A2D3V3X1_9PEZI|nr:uncharacterized protein RCC_10716 [Ramularia collo-cygni]CZT24987.1 uncharacterized protein RCC_10716 [Ramularia collo-cygni]